MADYTVTTNNRQEEALDWVLARMNANRAAQVPPLAPVAKDDFVQSEFREVVRRHLDEFRDFKRRDIGDLYAEANASKRAQVDAILKG